MPRRDARFVTESRFLARVRGMDVLPPLLLAQSLLSLTIDDVAPVRFGYPLPARALARGLHLEAPAGGRLQWSLLQEKPNPTTGRQWVEIAISGARGRVRVVAGGIGPVESGSGELVTVSTKEIVTSSRARTIRTWTWLDGTEDSLDRTVYLAPAVDQSGEEFDTGEAASRWSPDLISRRLRARIPTSAWRVAGVLPRARSRGGELPDQLLEVLRFLPRCRGARGAGDYVRGEGTVTNLEFDTALAFAQLALATGSRDAIGRAHESAHHLIDRDLESTSGLPFRHGSGHRSARPEPGHVWVRGLLLTGCLFADRVLIEQALTIARSLGPFATTYQARERWEERARDIGWPLFELEHVLRFADTPALRRSADALADELMKRWDPIEGVFRFGEGESRGRAYKERCWLTAGILLPGLREYHRRTGDRRVEAVIEKVETRLVRLIKSGRKGIPLRYWVRDGSVFGVLRARSVPECFLLLDGLGTRARNKCLRRGSVRSALESTLDPMHPDLATHFTMIARCSWIWE